MSVYKKITENNSPIGLERTALDERFITLFLDEDAQERLEAQELRQLVHRAMNELSDLEFKVIESRYQYKKSPGQAAYRIGITRENLLELEESALGKLRSALTNWQRSH
tara:strand:+ start:61 stop:387 length:327 start_codon:yes stop_codon:yes gene_type:complete